MAKMEVRFQVSSVKRGPVFMRPNHLPYLFILNGCKPAQLEWDFGAFPFTAALVTVETERE